LFFNFIFTSFLPKKIQKKKEEKKKNGRILSAFLLLHKSQAHPKTTS